MKQDLIDKGIYWSKALSLVENCSKTSEGCLNCWLEAMNKRFGRHSDIIRFREDRLNIPAKTRTPQVFAIWSDIFHKSIPDDSIDDALMTAFNNPQHTFLFLTKRAGRLFDFYDDHNDALYFDKNNNWMYFGCTTENQQRADERIPLLLQVPGKRFLSLEPLLEPINLFRSVPALFGTLNHPPYAGNIHAAIVGAESGPHRRTCRIEWIEEIVEQCKTAKVPCFVKQIHDSKGRVAKDISKFPESLRVRELPWF